MLLRIILTFCISISFVYHLHTDLHLFVLLLRCDKIPDITVSAEVNEQTTGDGKDDRSLYPVSYSF